MEVKATTTPPSKKDHVTNDLNEKKEKKIVSIRKNGGSDEQAQWAMEIYKQCGDIMAVYTVEAESGFRHDIVSKPNRNGSRDYYLFQFNSTYHGDWIKTPEAKNPERQIERGCGIWHDAVRRKKLRTTWYGYNNIVSNPKAMQNVKSRFTVTYE